LLAGALSAGELLPWLCGGAVIAYYVDDMLATINVEHRYVLRLIDDNSPRISAAEDTNETTAAAAASTPGAAGAVPTLRVHNLGAVKFIDSDGPTHTRIHSHHHHHHRIFVYLEVVMYGMYAV